MSQEQKKECRICIFAHPTYSLGPRHNTHIHCNKHLVMKKITFVCDDWKGYDQ